MSRVVAIIPARGGSKRLPRKNILPLKGRPIIAYTIEAAQKSKVFTDVIVSTEDMEIAEVSKSFGASIHERDASLSTDKARVRDVCEAIVEESKLENTPIDVFCVLTATSALRAEEDIVISYEKFKQGYDFLVSVTDYFFYPHAAMFENENGDAEFYFKDLAHKKGQEIPELFVENGSINWCKTESFLETGELSGPNTGTYRMPKSRSIDIDTEDDFVVLDAIFGNLNHGS
jgi:CMP-N-acetylneuraminic acid synthetase